MIGADGYAHFGGIHSESAALKNLLAFHKVAHPVTGKPLSEALCFGIAGGIGAGSSFCPSVIRHGTGSGVAVVGRHKVYATGPSWYQDFCDRVGIATRVTETAAKGKALQNLFAELEAGRPAVVWCGAWKLPFLGFAEHVGVCMHTFIVHAADPDAGIAHGSDLATSRVSLTLDELADARNSVCSHKNRTLTIAPPGAVSADVLRSAVRSAMQACAKEMLDGRIGTFSLDGLAKWGRMITNDKSKDGWPKVFTGGLLGVALKDVYHSIVTSDTGGDLFRGLYADFLDEAAVLCGKPALAELANTYRGLGKQWVELAEVAFPGKVKPFKQMKELLHKRNSQVEKGEKGQKQVLETAERLRKLEQEMKQKSPLSSTEGAAILEQMRQRIEDLHRQETAAAEQLAALSK